MWPGVGTSSSERLTSPETRQHSLPVPTGNFLWVYGGKRAAMSPKSRRHVLLVDAGA
jgi:hypothetical protein